MMKTKLFLAFLATMAVLTLMASAPVPSDETQRKIDTICRSNEDYGFCNKVFQYHLPDPDTDYVGLARITVEEARNNATNTLAFIRAQILVETDQAILSHFKVCEVAYTVLKLDYDEAYYAFIEGNYEAMVADEWNTPRIQASCSTIFSEIPYVENVLNEMNREMRILITMAVVTSTYLVPRTSAI